MSYGVEVWAACDPQGRYAVLLQSPDGFVLRMRHDEARQVAAALVGAADEISLNA